MATMQPAGSCAPWQELLARQGAVQEHPPGGIESLHLNHSLGQIDPDANGLAAGFSNHPSSCNLLQGLPLSQARD